MAYCRIAQGLSSILILTLLPCLVRETSTCDIKYLLTTTSRYIPESNMHIHMALLNEDFYNSFTVNITLRTEKGDTLYRIRDRIMGSQFRHILDFPYNHHTNAVILTMNLTRVSERAPVCRNSARIPVGLSSNLRHFFIQTERPWYTPGQTVKSRIFISSRDGIPRPTRDGHVVIFNCTITDPENNIMYNEALTNSVFKITDVDFKLPRYPIIGTWKISCSFQSAVDVKFFEVKKEVVSRFEVALWNISTESITSDTKFVTGFFSARYTYDEPFGGLFKVTFDVGYSDNQNTMFILKNNLCAPIEKTIVGMTSFTCDTKEIPWANIEVKRGSAFLMIRANVTEVGTGITQPSHPILLKLAPKSFRIEISGDRYFKPGVPYNFTIALKTVAGTPHVLTDERLELYWRQNAVSTPITDCLRTGIFICHRIFNGDGVITLITTIQFTDRTAVHGNKKVNPWFSKNGQYLTLYNPSISKPLSCQGEFSVPFWHTPSPNNLPITLYWTVSGRREMLENNFVTSNANTPAGGISGSIKIRALPAMAPEARMLMYYGTSDGEVVSDAIILRFEQCLPLTVSLSTPQHQYEPDYEVSVTVAATSSSQCLISVMDKGILLGGHSKINETARLFSILQKYESPNDTEFALNSTDQMHCPFVANQEAYSDFVDASDSFIKAKVTVMTNVPINTRRCNYATPYVRTSNSRQRTGQSVTPVSATLKERTNFNETFIWETVNIGGQNFFTIARKVPHSITTWMGSAICIHKSDGLGISNPVSFSTFQRFFVNLNLPYSLIIRETVSVVVSLHNYFRYNLPMKLTLDVTPGVSLTSTVCSRAESVQTHSFTITPTELGLVSIRAKAELSKDDSSVCSGGDLPSDSSVEDTITKQLLVEPAGVRTQKQSSELVCILDGQSSRTITMSLRADNAIQKTLSAHIFVSRDCFTLSLANMGHLIRPAMGCAEQTTSAFAPMIFALHYLAEVRSLDDETRSKARTYISEGINNLHSFWTKTTDSSEGAFGFFPNDKPGDIWLTAFIFKCLNFAKKFLPIDEAKQEMMAAFLKSRPRNENGCINEMGRYSYLWGYSVFSQRKLTAYVLIALLEAKHPSEGPLMTDMLRCLGNRNAGTAGDIHEQALVAYAYSLADSTGTEWQTVINSLLSSSTTYDNGGETQEYWYTDVKAKGIETSAYVLLTLLHKSYKPEAVLRISRWLIRQSDSRGHFHTTQATSVAAQALAGLSKTPCFGSAMAIEVSTSYNIVKKHFYTSCVNRANFSYAEEDLTDQTMGDPRFDFTLSGTGCSRVTAALRYHEEPIPQIAALQPIVLTTSKVVGAKISSLTICASYSDQEIDMTMIEVRIVTGWTASRESLDDLIKSQVRHYEIMDNYVYLYFDKFTTQSTCIKFDLICAFKVTALPGLIHAYAYYRPEIATYQEYELQECDSNQS